MSEERKLATIRRVAEVKPIVGADMIEAVRVDGWWVVAKKDEYKPGDLAVYLEVDSWVPHDLAPFLTKPNRDPLEYMGVKGQRLRTIKLKGQLSQGLLLPITVVDWGTFSMNYLLNDTGDTFQAFSEGDDVTDFLGIQKWEKPMNPQLAGIARGNFPSFIPKTDQERIQNRTRDFENWQTDGSLWEVTEKLDGSSMTVYVKYVEDDPNGQFGVCSRNLDLECNLDNAFWKAAYEADLHNKIVSTGRSLALQGELIGEGIQGNLYKLKGQHFYVFDIYDIDRGEYLLPLERQLLCNELDIQHVPFVYKSISLSGLNGVAELLEYAEDESMLNGVQREGLVFKRYSEPHTSFKAISNAWLLKNE